MASTRKIGLHFDTCACSARPLMSSVFTSGSTLVASTATPDERPPPTRRPARPARRGRQAMRAATRQRSAPAPTTIFGGPIHEISDTATAHASPAPMRSAKYSVRTLSVRRPNRVAIITPIPMNGANNARQITINRARLLNDARDAVLPDAQRRDPEPGHDQVGGDDHRGGHQRAEQHDRVGRRPLQSLRQRDLHGPGAQPQQGQSDDEVRVVVEELERHDPRVGDLQHERGERDHRDLEVVAPNPGTFAGDRDRRRDG